MSRDIPRRNALLTLVLATMATIVLAFAGELAATLKTSTSPSPARYEQERSHTLQALKIALVGRPNMTSW